MQLERRQWHERTHLELSRLMNDGLQPVIVRVEDESGEITWAILWTEYGRAEVGGTAKCLYRAK